MEIEELDFLRESNNIEDEWDDKSLQDAILAWQYCKRFKKLTPETILMVHGLLMESRDTIEEKDKGHFRKCAVYIGGHEAKPWYAVPNLVNEWIERVNKSLRLRDGKEAATHMFHVQYEAIHPFLDGNGRTGRIFYNWHRQMLKLPIHTIHVGKEQYEYYKWFQ